MLDIDHMPLWRIVDDLRGIKVKGKDLTLLRKARRVGPGVLKLSEKQELRNIAKRRIRQLRELYESRDKARHTIAKMRMGKSGSGRSCSPKSKTDLGF